MNSIIKVKCFKSCTFIYISRYVKKYADSKGTKIFNANDHFEMIARNEISSVILLEISIVFAG